MADFKWKVNGGHMAVADSEGGTLAEFNMRNYSDEIRQRIADFGFKALFQARASQVATADKVDYWVKLDEQFAAGEWEAERTRGAIVVAPWVEVLASQRNTTTASVQQALSAYSKEQRSRIKANTEELYAAEIEGVKARRAEATVDLSDLA